MLIMNVYMFVVIDCGSPCDVAHGARHYNGTTYNDTATYACHTGHYFSSSSIVEMYISCEVSPTDVTTGKWLPIVDSQCQGK